MLAGFNTVALQDEEFSNFLEGKTKILGLTNEFQRLDLVWTEKSEAALGPRRAFQQTLLFVEPNGVYSEPGLLRYLTDLGWPIHGCSSTHHQHTIWSQLQSQVFSRKRRSLKESIEI